MKWRKGLTRFFLWVSVLAWGPLVGAKVFDLVVLVGAWSASPPASLRLLPYGPDYPVDTGEFFIPSSAALLVSTVGALIVGWRTPLKYRAMLATSMLCIFSMLVLTVAMFWPLNAALWAVAQNSSSAGQTPSEVVEIVRTWVALDWVRVAVGSIGFVSAVRALSIPFPEERAPADPPAVTVALIVAAIGIAAFVVYFVSNV
jgi:hypothetical protein